MREAEREAYRLHAKLPVFRRRVAAACAVVRRAMAEHPGVWAVSMSGGKDSTALLALCLDAGWRGPVFHFWCAETPPENTASVASLAARFGLRLDTAHVPGEWDAYDAVGHFFAHPETPEEKTAARAAVRGYKAGAARAAAEAGYAGLFMGMRVEESRARAIVCARKGAVYRTADRAAATALPLARWTARDVWAWHLARGLPWLARYDLAAPEDGGRERERSEPAWLVCDRVWQHGQGPRMRESDPALWARLVARWPELAAWG